MTTSPSHLLHDPGGKTRIAVRGMTGDALFSGCGTRRYWLSRDWDGGIGTILWIGMNPSTATDLVNDNTVNLEVQFSRAWGYARYLKANVMDYRATKPKDLLVNGVVPCSQDNLEHIRELARRSDRVVVAFGALHKKLLRHGQDVLDLLKREGIEPYCLGLTKAGLPRHPLYMRTDTLLRPYPGLVA